MPSSLDLLPPPFGWIDIPAGQVTLKQGGYVPAGGKTYDLSAFTIAKYPVTNAQFAPFMSANGYQERRWWTEQGWQTREKENWLEPRYLYDPKLNLPDHPVVGVTWHEAVAYCLWLSEVTGEAIMLPTEQQWQHAAQGNSNRPYPWGDEPDHTRCNNCVKIRRKKNSTSPVTKYEGKGDSPYGVVDMCGNAGEWCLTGFYNGLDDYNMDANEVRVALRGYGWTMSLMANLEITFRGGFAPWVTEYATGFRLSRALP
jgi:formylglycine-generating enzyme required for sulfatase activity